MTHPEPRPATRGNSNDHVRRHNLSMILGLVHRERGMSRSQLTQRMGLNRSTIAALVGELAELDLVREGDAQLTNQVGRPSPMVRPSSTPVGIAVNPDIDAITLGVVGLGGVVHSITRHSLADPLPAKDTASIMASMIETAGRSLTPDQRIVGVGVAVPGLVRLSDGLVRLAPHLDWHDEPFAAMLQQLTGLPVSAANDAHLGARAEGAFGAARDAQDMLYLNGGASGIGGGIIASGVPIAGANGYAGELGHTMVNPYGIACHCGAVGCLETEVRRDRLLEVTGLDPESADRLPEHLATSEDSRVSAEVARQLDFLTVALRNGINTLNPQLVILGGFLGPLFAADTARLNGFAANRPLSAPRDSVTIRSSTLGSELLLLGAGELAFEALLADPASF